MRTPLDYRRDVSFFTTGDGINTVDIKGKGVMELSGGVLHLRWKPGAYIGIEVARAALEAISTLCQGGRVPMLVELQGVSHSAASRREFPSASDISRMALVGSSPVDRVVAMFRLSFVSAGFPVRYFTSADKAMAWLLSPSQDAVAEPGEPL